MVPLEYNIDQLAEKMLANPKFWAEYLLEQQDLVKTLSQMAEDYKNRLELLLLEAGEQKAH